MPSYTPRLNLPVPTGPEIHRRQVIVDLANAIDDAVAAQSDLERPFFASSLAYEAGPNRLALTLGPGRARFGTQLVDRAAGTVYVANPANNTTYYVYILNDGTADGDILVNTTGAEIANAILLHSAAVGASTAALTLTDLRAEIYGTASAQPHTHDGTVTPTVAMLNNRFITGKDTPGGVDRNLVGLDAANSTILGHNVAGRATRVLAGSQASVEVAGVNAAVFTTSLATLIGGLTLSGPITGATTVAGTMTTAAQPNITSLGTLVSLAVTGAGTFGSVSASGGITGTLQTAAQPNVTSLGTLVSLNVAGALVAASLATAGAVSGATLTGTVQTAAQPNITSLGTLASLTMAGNIAMAGHNITGAGTLSGTTLAGTLSTAAQPNVTSLGTLASLAVSAGVTAASVSATTLTGTLSTAAQPNVTSLGSLSSLNVAGTASFTGGVTMASNLYVSTYVQSGGYLTAPQLFGTLQTAAQPNVTSLGTLNGLSAISGQCTFQVGSGVVSVVKMDAALGSALNASVYGSISTAGAAVNGVAYSAATSQPVHAGLLGHGTAPLLLASTQAVYFRLIGAAPYAPQWQTGGGGPGVYYGRFPISLDGTQVWVPMYS